MNAHKLPPIEWMPQASICSTKGLNDKTTLGQLIQEVEIISKIKNTGKSGVIVSGEEYI
jgi:hypothetical protein